VRKRVKKDVILKRSEGSSTFEKYAFIAGLHNVLTGIKKLNSMPEFNKLNTPILFSSL